MTLHNNTKAHWVLTQFGPHPDFPDVHPMWPIAAAHGNGHISPRYPENADGWALVLCGGLDHESARRDPRVAATYRTVWDVITPETVTAYAAQGATAGMMLCQLLSLLAEWEPGFGMGI
jgi:hypothetical protein